MMPSNKNGLALALAPVLVLGACGGSIDFATPRPSEPATKGGAASTAAGGGAQQAEQTDPIASGGQLGAGGKVDPPSPAEAAAGAAGAAGPAGAAGAPAPVGEPHRAILAFDAEPDGESRGIYWVSAPESACRERISPDGASAKQPAFSRDGTLIAYAAEDDDGTYQIFTWETATRITRQVTDLPQGATYPTFMPSGAGLAFVTGDPEGLRDGLVSDTPDMGELMLLNLKTLETQLLEPRTTTVDYPYFAPAFATQDSLLVSNSYAIRELRLDFTGQTTTIVNRRILTSPGVPQEPAPSPDGLNVAYADTCTDTLRLYWHSIALGSLRSCTPPSRDYLPTAGVRSADWGAFGFIAAELNAPNASGLPLFNESDLSNGPTVATPKHPRNPSWGPADFTRYCE